MPISPVNLFWLTDPHDLHGTPCDVVNFRLANNMSKIGIFALEQCERYVNRILRGMVVA